MASKTVRYQPNNHALQEWLDGKHGVASICKAEASEQLRRAKTIAPVATGAYRDSLRIWTDHTDRLAVHVGSDLPYAMTVEARHGVLARSI